MDSEVDKLRAQGREKAAQERAELKDFKGDFLFTCASSEEAGDSELFIQIYHGKLVFDHAQGIWYKFQGHFWVPCEVDEPLAMVGGLADLYGEAAKKEFFRRETAAKANRETEADQAAAREKIYLKKIAKLQRRLHRNNVLVLAAAGEGSLGISGRQWDTKSLLLPCVNGILDLETGDFRAGRPGDFITKYCPVAWEGFDAPAPRWEAFIFQILGDDAEKAAFLKRLFGCFITGNVTEHVFPVPWGPGRNGKSVLFETLGFVMGPLAGPVQSEMLMQQKQPRSAAAPSPDVIALRGLRLAWASESDEGRHLNAGKVKWFTGNDTLVGRGPYDRRMVSFRPSHNLILLTNFRPHGNPQDAALWARILSIRFPYSFVDSPSKPNERLRDPNLADSLKAESPGILAWLVAGFYEWQEKGLSPPRSILAETDAYRLSDDSVCNFLNECCLDQPGNLCRASELHEAYTAFCEQEGFKPKGKKTFFQRLQEEFIKQKGRNGIFYKGLGLKE